VAGQGILLLHSPRPSSQYRPARTSARTWCNGSGSTWIDRWEVADFLKGPDEKAVGDVRPVRLEPELQRVVITEFVVTHGARAVPIGDPGQVVFRFTVCAADAQRQDVHAMTPLGPR
jgi:hypothetical protein